MKILLAVSGGKDSMTMSDLSLRAARGESIKGFERFRDAVLGIAHCNFHLRPGDCDEDAALVQAWAKKMGLPYFGTDFDTRAYAAEHKLSLEMAARELRYGFFARLCSEQGYEAVAVAHHAQDQAETLLLHLLRSCGLEGARGMAAESRLEGRQGTAALAILRPMLSYSREAIENYVRERGIPYREDASNAELVFQRNILRNKVLPILGEINPLVVGTLCRDAENFTRSADALDVLAGRALSFADVSSQGIRFPAADENCRDYVYDMSRMLPHTEGELVFRLLRMYGFSPAILEDVLSVAKEENPEGRLFLSEEGRMLQCGSLLRFRRNGYRVREPEVVTMPWEEGTPHKTPEGTTRLDADALPAKWELRPWREGDWMKPLGMDGKRKKLSDLFTDLHFDLFDKEDARVLAPAEGSETDPECAHVRALVGWRIDESVQVVPGRTKTLLQLRYLLRSC
ncbi:MAG: tRNA lysidine(34) synthetase TilS [Bacteroidales bacterium]|nr:tRNA lysidine(34) synthetase TilS [Bacteroidales bacterium]